MTDLKILSSGDWEITRERLPALTVAVDCIAELMAAGDYDIFVYTGDLFRHFGPHEAEWARRYFTVGLVSAKTGHPPIVLAGNHDWRADINELEGVFGPRSQTFTEPKLITSPQVVMVDGWELAFLPAPNRDSLGATLDAQGPRERDAEISKVLEAALVEVEGQLSQPIASAVLFFHATVNTTLFNGSKLGEGLTWTIDGGRLSRWGAAIGGHIHNTTNLGAEYVGPGGDPAQILYTGTVIHDTHGQKAQRFRALEINLEAGKIPAVKSIPLPTVVVPIEAVWTVDGFQGPEDKEVYATAGLNPAIALIGFLADRCGVRASEDYVDIKLRARMPRADLDLLPLEGKLKQGLVDAVGAAWIANLKIKREEIATHKDVLEEAHDVGALDLEQLFELWLSSSGLTDHPNAEAARLLVGQHLDDWKVETNVGVRMIKTRVENFRQWQDVEINWDDLKGTTAVIGDNEAGKTNLVEAPLFAWYKKTPRTEGRLEGLKYELNHDADKGLVEHDWEASGKRYRIRRAMERNQAGEVSCKTELLGLPLGGIDPVGGHLRGFEPIASGLEADKKIIEIVGGYDFVVSTFYGTATQINKLIDATPARWHEIFIEALSLGRFEVFRKDAAKAQRDAEGEAEKADTRTEQLAGLVTAKAEEANDLRDPGRITEDIAAGGRNLSASEATIAAHQKEKERLVGVRAGIELRASQEARLVASVGSAQQALKKLEATPARDAGIRPDTEGEGDIDAAELAVTNARTAIKTAREWVAEVANDQKIRTEQIESHQRVIKRHAARNLALDIEIRKLKDGVELPPCDKLADDLYPRLKTSCPAWAAYAQPAMVEKLQAELGTITIETEHRTNEIARIQAEIDKGRDRVVEADGQVELTKANAAEVEVERDKIRDQGKDLQVWELKRKAFLAYQDRLAEATKRLTALEAERAEIKGATAQLAEIQDTIRDLETKIYEQKKESERLRTAIKHLEADQVKTVELHKQLEALTTQHAEAGKEAVQLRAKASVLALVAQAFHNSGIPFLLIDRMVPAFQAEANRILATTHLSVRVEQSRPIGTGGDKKEVDELRIYFTDNRGTFPLKLCSGEQRVAVGLPLRAALAKVGSEFWGNIPEVFVQDEGWGAFHGSKVAMGLEMIRKISESFQTFIYITHKDEMAEAADQVLEVLAGRHHPDLPREGSRVVIT